MTSKYDDFPEYRQPNLDPQDTEGDCFELLSAYIDGEATPAERQQVQKWLDNDPEIKQVYLQLLKLQNGMQTLSVPSAPEITPDLLSERVFTQINRDRRQRKLLLWGGGAIAATLIAAVSGVVPGFNSPNLKLAESSVENAIDEALSDSVMVAVTLNQPTVKIPKAAISSFPVDQNSDRRY